MSLQAPFPYFGGKGKAAKIIWELFGDVSSYIEPFCGSAAVLLARPPFKGQRFEIINDADGLVVNVWRAIQHAPEQVAKHAAAPKMEIEYHARLACLAEQHHDKNFVSWLEGDPNHYDTKLAGWWLYATACCIGKLMFTGPWKRVDGHLIKQNSTSSTPGITRTIPQIAGNVGQGIFRRLPGEGDRETLIREDMKRLQRRLEGVRITCGHWERVLTPSWLTNHIPNKKMVGVFLDPPYATSWNLYNTSECGIGERVRGWCKTAPEQLRIVLCGYEDEHDELLQHGWEKTDGKAGVGRSKAADAGRREKLWYSPACDKLTQAALL